MSLEYARLVGYGKPVVKKRVVQQPVHKIKKHENYSFCGTSLWDEAIWYGWKGVTCRRCLRLKGKRA